MSRTPWRQPVRVADVIPATFQRLGLEGRFRQHEVWRVWSAVVGPQIARHAQPHAVWHGRLIVHVTDPVWLHHLSMLRPRVIAALNERLRSSVVREMMLRVGEIPADLPEPKSPQHPGDDHPPDPVRLSRIETLLAPLRGCPFHEALSDLLQRASWSSGGTGPR